MSKILVKSKNTKLDTLSSGITAQVLRAKQKLSELEVDRYYRAVKVWYNTKTNEFEFEDNHV